MSILALNPYHGGSHRDFLEGWVAHSDHAFEVLTLPPHKWKWRMRHGAITLADRVHERVADGARWKAVFCTDMLNLAEFRGIVPRAVASLPTVAYFHENQLTYPVQREDERDLHYGFANIITAKAADRVWFNSTFHLDTFLAAAEWLLRGMPDHQPLAVIDEIRAKSVVQPPGITVIGSPERRQRGPLRIVWVSRWEHDKAPEVFFSAILRLMDEGVDFRVSVLGESFANVPEVFEQSRRKLEPHIDRWGFVADRETYRTLLRDADVVVSTARHEFFGIAVVEAASAGCVPIVPESLAYPTVLGTEHGFLFHDGTVDGVVARLRAAAGMVETAEFAWLAETASKVARRFDWSTRALELDSEIAALTP